MRLDHASPFVLLDDARAEGAPARLYRAPVAIVRADRVEDVLPALERLRDGVRRGLDAAGFLSYDAGPAFEPRLKPRADAAAPLLWFGLFDGHERIARDAVPDLLPQPDGAFVGTVQPDVTRAAWAA